MSDLIKRLSSFEYLSLEHICCEAAACIKQLQDALIRIRDEPQASPCHAQKIAKRALSPTEDKS